MAALTGSGFSSRSRGSTALANRVMFATVSAWSRKPPWPKEQQMAEIRAFRYFWPASGNGV
jgi:hypothetical protein